MPRSPDHKKPAPPPPLGLWGLFYNFRAWIPCFMKIFVFDFFLGLMRQVWNEVVWQITKNSTIQPSQKTRCTCQHLSLCLFESVLQIHILSEYCQAKWQVVKWGIKYRNFYSVRLVHCFQTAKSVFLNVNFQIFPCLTNYFQLCVKISPSCIWL